MDTVKSILKGQTVVTVDTTNYDVVVETIPSTTEPSPNSSSNLKAISVSIIPPKSDNSYLIKLFSDILGSGKAGFVLKCSIQKANMNNQYFVHVLPVEWSLNSVFTYIPTFQIVCSCRGDLETNGQNKVGLVMNLVSFNGKLLSHQSETLTFAGVADGQEVDEASMVVACAGSRLLKLFSDGLFSLCQGVIHCKKIENTLRSHGLQSGMYLLRRL